MNWLLDRDSPFLELSTLCGLGMHEDNGVDNVYGGGLIAGIGFVAGVRCLVAANDSGIKGGAAHPMGVEKAIRAAGNRAQRKLPYVQLVESAGANPAPGRDVRARRRDLRQHVAHVGGGNTRDLDRAWLVNRGRRLSDRSRRLRRDGARPSKVFLAGPPLLKAATGEIAKDEALGGAELHGLTTGLGEYLAEDDADALRIGREILAHLGWAAAGPRTPARAPLYDPEELLGIVPVDYRKPYDVREVIARIVDGSDFLDFKPGYGPGPSAAMRRSRAVQSA